MGRPKKRLVAPKRSEIDKKWGLDKTDKEDYPGVKTRNKEKVLKYNNGKDYGLNSEGKPKMRPGPRKTRPTLTKSDGGEFEKITTEEAVVRGKMVMEGIPVNPRAKFVSVEDYRKLPKCGAKRRGKYRYDKDGNQQYCQNVAGARTNHVGVGKCWLHGGRSTGPIKYRQDVIDSVNLNLKNLTTEEQEVYNRIPTSIKEQLENDLRFITLRESRMMARMNQLIAEGRMSVVEQSMETKGGGSEGGEFLDSYDIEVKRSAKSVTNLERIQNIEDQLTRLGKQKLAIMEKLKEVRDGGQEINVNIGGRKGASLTVANIGNIPTEELQRQLDLLNRFEE